MKMLINLLARGIIILFWLGVVGALADQMPGRLNDFLPPCAVVVILMHWAQASMVRKLCAPYFAVSRAEYGQILIFGVFATGAIRARLTELTSRH